MEARHFFFCTAIISPDKKAFAEIEAWLSDLAKDPVKKGAEIREGRKLHRICADQLRRLCYK